MSNTNQGIDDILLKLKNVGRFNQFIRVTSNTSSVNPEIRPFVKEANGFDSFADIRRFIDNYQVYGATCNQVGNPLLLLCGVFDYCIMGDASQFTEPLAIGPLLIAKKFVMIGDYKMYSPQVKSPMAQRKGMG